MKFNSTNEYTKESRIREQSKNKRKKNPNQESKMRDPSLNKTNVKHRNQIYNYMFDND